MATIKQCDVCGRSRIGLRRKDEIHVNTIEFVKPVLIGTISMDESEYIIRTDIHTFEICNICYDKIKSVVEELSLQGPTEPMSDLGG